jgi:glutamate dehydrogenase
MLNSTLRRATINSISRRTTTSLQAAQQNVRCLATFEKSAPSHQKSWVNDQSREDLQRVTTQAMINELTTAHTSSVNDTVPWFLDVMPASYFRQNAYATRVQHMKTITALRNTDMDLNIDLRATLPTGQQILTYIRPSNEKSLLLHLLTNLPKMIGPDGNIQLLTHVQVYTSSDDNLCLNIFTFGSASSEATIVPDSSVLLDYAEKINSGELKNDGSYPLPGKHFEREAMVSYMKQCSDSYITNSTPRRFLNQVSLFQQVSGGENVAVTVEPHIRVEGNVPAFWVDIAMANSIPQAALEHAARVLKLHKFDVIRSHLDVVKDGNNGEVTMIRMCVEADEGFDTAALDDLEHEEWNAVKKDMKRIKWLDPYTMDLVMERFPWLGIQKGEIITALTNLVHTPLSKKSSVEFSKFNINNTVTNKRYINHSDRIASLFTER